MSLFFYSRLYMMAAFNPDIYEKFISAPLGFQNRQKKLLLYKHKHTVTLRTLANLNAYTKFRYNLPPIGHKYPRIGRMSVQRNCPLCPHLTPNNSSHLALFCPYVEGTRRDQTSFSMFRNSCILIKFIFQIREL